jgi:hypothetical protein
MTARNAYGYGPPTTKATAAKKTAKGWPIGGRRTEKTETEKTETAPAASCWACWGACAA